MKQESLAILAMLATAFILSTGIYTFSDRPQIDACSNFCLETETLVKCEKPYDRLNLYEATCVNVNEPSVRKVMKKGP